MNNKFDWMAQRYIDLYPLCSLWPHIDCQIILGYSLAERLQKKYRDDMIESIYYS